MHSPSTWFSLPIAASSILFIVWFLLLLYSCLVISHEIFSDNNLFSTLKFNSKIIPKIKSKATELNLAGTRARVPAFRYLFYSFIIYFSFTFGWRIFCANNILRVEINYVSCISESYWDCNLITLYWRSLMQVIKLEITVRNISVDKVKQRIFIHKFRSQAQK